MQRISITACLGMSIGDQSNPTAVRSHSRPKAALFDLRAAVLVDGLFLCLIPLLPTLIEGRVCQLVTALYAAHQSCIRPPRLPYVKARWTRQTADRVEIYCKTLNICLAVISRRCLPRVSQIPHFHLYLLIELCHSTPPPLQYLGTCHLSAFTFHMSSAWAFRIHFRTKNAILIAPSFPVMPRTFRL